MIKLQLQRMLWLLQVRHYSHALQCTWYVLTIVDNSKNCIKIIETGSPIIKSIYTTCQYCSGIEIGIGKQICADYHASSVYKYHTF
ncbi:hypothetical protein Plhal304r1_c050g0132901 [Plasmopara halstedii]